MPSLTLKNLPAELLERLRERAEEERRSLNQQAIHILERALHDQAYAEAEAQAAEWRALGGSWGSDLDTPEEIASIYAARSAGRVVDL